MGEKLRNWLAICVVAKTYEENKCVRQRVRVRERERERESM